MCCSTVFPAWATRTYTCIKLLSQGAFGNVWLVRSSSGTMLVFKEIFSPGDARRLTPRTSTDTSLEATLLAANAHPFIVRFVEMVRDKPSKGTGLVTEFCDQGDLHTLLLETRRRGESVPEPQVLTWLAQICSALAHLHRHSILHRDVKTANIFVSADNTAKLGDFGLARSIGIQHDAIMSRVGSPFYLSPEICINQPYGTESDVWSLGCVLYEMVCLSKAFYADSMPAVVQRICTASYAPPPSSSCSDGVRELITRMLQLRPQDRPTVQELLQRPLLCSKLAGLEPFSPPEFMRYRLETSSPEVEAMRRAVREATARQPQPQLKLLERFKGLSFFGIKFPEAIKLAPQSRLLGHEGVSATGSRATGEAVAMLNHLREHLTFELGTPLLEQALQLVAESPMPLDEAAARQWEDARLRDILDEFDSSDVHDPDAVLAQAVLALVVWQEAQLAMRSSITAVVDGQEDTSASQVWYADNDLAA